MKSDTIYNALRVLYHQGELRLSSVELEWVKNRVFKIKEEIWKF